MELVHQLDLANDVSVELVEFLGRYSQLEDRPSACLLNRVPAQEIGLDVKAGDKTGAVVLDVPVPRDLDGVLLVEDRVKDRLFRQPRRPGTPVQLAHQLEFSGTGGTPQRRRYLPVDHGKRS
ncbi:hypothetical protein J7I94_09425 [Streptomyces sp. ISL-12]|nr:hypothetical protein [Streptomyces sp. ISL-12]